MDRNLRDVALVAAAGMLGACAHVGQQRPLTTNEQLVASALSWAVRVPLPAPEYRVEVPPTYPRDAILAAAAADVGLSRRGATLRRPSEVRLRQPVRIAVQTPQRVAASAPPEFRVPFAVAVGAAESTTCVVRVRLRSNDPRSWLFATEGPEECWPRPGV